MTGRGYFLDPYDRSAHDVVDHRLGDLAPQIVA
jgi:hypothetical protein